jgi:CheY-like chemotaxis protein
MTSRGAQSSQVGLFITQISEQILRLRALMHAEDVSSSHDLVALKRAIMATRLLGGSARILQYASVHRFLEKLLVWLQQIEERGAKLGTTQALILDSVIDLEEQLMRHLETEASEEDLTPYEGEFEQLLRLMERSAEWKEAEPDSSAEPDDHGEVERALGDAGESPDVARLVGVLDSLVDHLETVSSDSPASIAPVVWEQLDSMSQRLTAAVSRYAELREEGALPDTEAEAEAEVEPEPPAPPEWPRDDPILDPLWEQIGTHSKATRLPIGLDAKGGAEIVGAGLHDVVRQILGFLLEDVLHALDDWRQEDSSAAGEVEIAIARENHRLHIAVRDNAPHLQDDGLRVDADHLTLYGGLRRARILIQQLNGLIAVEPQDDSSERFRLVLPAELRDQTYMIVHQDQVAVALPWVLTDGEVPAEDLELQTDAGGDSFIRHGRSIPLVDLAQYVPSLMPVADSAESVLVAGSVEKRIGIFCSGTGERIDAHQVGDPPQGWESVAYGGLNVEGEILPILDIHRLIRLRFDMPDSERGVSGAILDPVVDSYVAVEGPKEQFGAEEGLEEAVEGPEELYGSADEPFDAEETPQRGARKGASLDLDPSPPGPELRVLLVNQSEFRRRELDRSLSELGHTVAAYADLPTALREAEVGEFDVVVTDLRLGHTGKDNLDSLHEGSFVGPVILTSAAARDQAQALAKKVGADACWLDPYRPSDFESLQRALF